MNRSAQFLLFVALPLAAFATLFLRGFYSDLPSNPASAKARSWQDVGTLVDIRHARIQVWRVETTGGIWHIEYATSGRKGVPVCLSDDGFLYIDGASLSNKILE